MVVFWILTALVYLVIGGIIWQWMNEVMVENGTNPLSTWWSVVTIFVWPLVTYFITVLVVIYGLWLLCKKAWNKVKSWFKKDKPTTDTDLNTDIDVMEDVVPDSSTGTVDSSFDASAGIVQE